MPCHPSAHIRDTWGLTTSTLLIAFLCYLLPWQAWANLPTDDSVLRIQGSNTIGARLGPALVKGLFEQQGFTGIRLEAGELANEQRVIGFNNEGRRVSVEVAAHGSGTGFTALEQGHAELAASSRPIKDSEASKLAALGNLRSPEAEQVIALDGLAIIVHPSNPLQALRNDQLAAVFAGEINDWAQLGGPAGSIRLYARDNNSGTFDTFQELVLGAFAKELADSALRFESSEELSDRVSRDPQAIGFIGLPYIRAARALAIAAGESQAMPASASLIATEDYPLSRRLFLYSTPEQDNPWARALIQFAHSPQGQAIVEQNGFIAQTVLPLQVTVEPGMPAAYQQLAQEAKRLTVNFRFQEGSATLDSKAQRDLQRLLGYLQEQDKLRNKLVLVGFGDAKADPARAELLSKLRAMAVRRELAKAGVIFRDIIGMGDELPVAANDQGDGRLKNRRVEVWVY